MSDLKALGFGPYFQAQFEAWAEPALIPARVAAEHHGAYEVWTASDRRPGQARRAPAPRACGERSAHGRRLGRPARGAGPGQHRIDRARLRAAHGLHPRRRGARRRVQVVAANVDLVYVVSSMDADFNLHRIQRYLARIHAGGATPGVILNKADLCADVADRVLDVELACPGVPVHAVSALRGEGVAAIRAAVGPGMTAAFLGSSGTGKSTLINALLGEARWPPAPCAPTTASGRHTTSHRQLLRLPGGGLLLDTPGMRELQLARRATGWTRSSRRSPRWPPQCRFPDCRHEGEPGCAVQAAMAAGAIGAEALAHWRKLEKEAHAYALRQDVRLRREAGTRLGTPLRAGDQGAEAEAPRSALALGP